MEHDLSTVLQHYKWVKREKLPSVYTTKEVFQIESSIHRENATGKRNYAMTLLATRLGLRATDITHLTFDNFGWENSTITLSQIKTGKKIELPLLVDVGEAITKNVIIDFLDWIQDNRHCSNATRNYRLAALRSFFSFLQYENPERMYEWQKILSIKVKRHETRETEH